MTERLIIGNQQQGETVTDPAVEAAQRAWNAGTDPTVLPTIAAAREALKPLRKLHRKDGDYCWTCDHTSWPCKSAKLIYAKNEL